MFYDCIPLFNSEENLVVTILHHTARLAAGMAVLLAAHAALAENLAERGMARLEANPPLCADAVDFIVCADPQPGGMLGTPKTFLDMIQEWNVLRPDFVMCAGDMIMGGPPAAVGEMWDEFEGAVAALDAPFFAVAGNHDVNDEPEVLRTYERRIAPFNYTVTRGNVLCVVLNTEEPGDPDGFSPEQRDWLRGALAASKAEHIFIFLHVPLFRGNWERDWAPAAEIIKGHPVRAVFAGHEHYYRDCGEIDGVRYVVAGSAGGGLGLPEEEGGFFCYLAVRVRGNEVSWSVVKPGAVLPADTVTEAGVARLRELRGMLTGETVELPWEGAVDREVAAVLKNPFDAPMQTTLRWTTPEGWQVDPRELVFEVPAGESRGMSAHLRSDGPARFPVPVLEGMVDNPETGEPVVLSLPLDLVPLTTAPHAPGPVTLDGDLAEWGAAPALAMTYGSGYDPADTADLKAAARLMWDEDHLYVAVEVEDNEFYQPYHGDVVWMADSVELWIENSNWSFSLSAKGPQVFLDERPDKHLDAVVPEVPLAVKRDGNRTVYEAAYPAAEVPHIPLEAGTQIRFSILVNDLDPSGPLEKRHYAELTPGAGQHFKCPMVRVTLGGKE